MLRLRWQTGPHLPAFLKGGAMGTVGGRPTYAAGMAYPWRETELVWRLDVEAGQWQAGPPLPLGRAYTHGLTVGDGLLLAGGRRSGPRGRQSLRDVWWLRPCGPRPDGAGLAWQRLPGLGAGRAVCALGTDGRRVLAVGGGVWETSQGGAFATRDLTRAEVLDLEDEAAGWRDLGPIPFATRAGAAFASLDGCAYLFGGYECWTDPTATPPRQVRPLDDAWRYDFGRGAWTRLGDLPGRMYGGCAVAVAPGLVVLVGGVLQARLGAGGAEVSYGVGHTRDAGTPRARHVGGYSDLAFLYQVGADRWTPLPERLPAGVNDNRCTAAAGRVWVAGGETVDAALSNTTELVAVAAIEDGVDGSPGAAAIEAVDAQPRD